MRSKAPIILPLAAAVAALSSGKADAIPSAPANGERVPQQGAEAAKTLNVPNQFYNIDGDRFGLTVTQGADGAQFAQHYSHVSHASHSSHSSHSSHYYSR
jgi:hypothetical protein